ncbi:MAG: hypothetical protein IPF87_17880 [Gemmatimonadetes bacterium]|jgi:hypothetical protein|nr:hypothetical protein [Gemmatimonadota bacterium]MBK9409866.1 hypothetical protein [Gemmatimonadota bacterium]MBK9977262.1 hypothetical protein [Gemmatimonadota bacterium]HNV73091.1 hypothetical protein [Gemmatimonadaceae bacterium]HPV76459.1 hypothetical protein [Gemmatimonadaceae bacterium]
MRRLLLGVALASVVSGGCATGSGGRGSAGQGRQSDVIYGSEIAKSSALNAYDAVRLLRPAFLAGRGPTTLLRPRESSVSPVVYLDNQRYGDSSTLRNIPIDGIVEIRFVGATQAQMRWGMDHPAGAILVLTGAARRVP